jgi:hypothetical protein
MVRPAPRKKLDYGDSDATVKATVSTILRTHHWEGIVFYVRVCGCLCVKARAIGTYSRVYSTLSKVVLIACNERDTLSDMWDLSRFQPWLARPQLPLI